MTDSQEPIAEAEEVVPPRLPWHQRLQNRVRMAVLHWLGVDFVLQNLNLRIGGTRLDLDNAVGVVQNNGQKLLEAIGVLNDHSHIINAWQHGDLRLRKLVAELRARQAKQQHKALTNGHTNGNGHGPTLVTSDGETPLRSEPPQLPQSD